MDSDEKAFEVFCSVYDEFEVQSKGRSVVSRGMEFYDLALTDPSPAVLVAYARSWLEEFSREPEFCFYRGNFFWKIYAKGGVLHAALIRKNTKGASPINKTLTWPVASADPKKVVKNLLDIMRSHERNLKKKREEEKAAEAKG